MSFTGLPVDQSTGAVQQSMTGGRLPADLINAAQALGYMPNPYASPAQQMMDITRFMALTKSVQDNMMGTNNAWNRLNPANPVMAMPANLQAFYRGTANIGNAYPGALPEGSQGMYQNGAYQRGPLGNNMSPLLRMYLAQQAPPQEPTQSQVIAAGGQSPVQSGGQNVPGGGGPGQGGGGPTPSAQSGINEGTNRGGGMTLPLLSGINDLARNVPVAGAALSGAENAIGDLTGQSNTQGGPAQGGGIPVLSGLNDLARTFPGVGGVEDTAGGIANALLGRNNVNNQQPGGSAGGPGASNLTVSTGNMPLPRTMAVLANKFGMNSIPPGIDVNDYVDNFLSRLLGGQ